MQYLTIARRLAELHRSFSTSWAGYTRESHSLPEAAAREKSRLYGQGYFYQCCGVTHALAAAIGSPNDKNKAAWFHYITETGDTMYLGTLRKADPELAEQASPLAEARYQEVLNSSVPKVKS